MVTILGWMNTKSIRSGGSSGPLSPFISLYLTQIKEQGYFVGSLYEQVHVLNHKQSGSEGRGDPVKHNRADRHDNDDADSERAGLYLG